VGAPAPLRHVSFSDGTTSPQTIFTMNLKISQLDSEKMDAVAEHGNDGIFFVL
jgi:hypothetical protein